MTQVLTRAWAGNSTLTVSVSLVPKSPLATGRVTDAASQNPIEGVWVVASWQDPGTAEWFWDGFDYTDSNGDYAVYDTDPRGAGAYRFYVEADGWLPVTTAPQAWDGRSTLVRNFMLELPPPVAAGTITSASGGAVIEGAAVETSWYDAVAGEYVFAGEAFSDAAGHYEVFDDIGYGAGTYELLVQKAGFAPVTGDCLEWGGTSALAQDVALDPLGALAIGSVSGPGGAPVEGATVETSAERRGRRMGPGGRGDERRRRHLLGLQRDGLGSRTVRVSSHRARVPRAAVAARLERPTAPGRQLHSGRQPGSPMATGASGRHCDGADAAHLHGARHRR